MVFATLLGRTAHVIRGDSMMHLTPSRHRRPTPSTWRDTVLGVLLVAALVALATVGHAWVSADVAHGQMPELRTEIFLPTISTEGWTNVER